MGQSKLKHTFEDQVVVCPLRYCFSLMTHVAMYSLNTQQNETEEMYCCLGNQWTHKMETADLSVNYAKSNQTSGVMS